MLECGSWTANKADKLSQLLLPGWLHGRQCQHSYWSGLVYWTKAVEEIYLLSSIKVQSDYGEMGWEVVG